MGSDYLFSLAGSRKPISETAWSSGRNPSARPKRNLNSTNFDTYTIFSDDVKHFLRKSLGILKKMLDFLSEVYYNRNILD